jgi:AGZA family xanthine/uracil permease-like MFS transporter
VIDGKFKNAGGFALAGAVMSSVGIIHAAALQMPQLSGITGGYLIMGVALIAYPIWGKVESLVDESTDKNMY